MNCNKKMAERFERLASIGAHNGGITRLAFTDDDWRARAVIREMMEEAGLAVRVDIFGNLIGRREGINPQASVVMLGSHIDSVPNGGNFDGIVGVLGAIEVIHRLSGIDKNFYHPLEVIAFMAEESSRFGRATLGSKAFCGDLSFDDLERYKDKQGISLAQAMRQRGLVPENISQAQYSGEIKAFLEMHIEQGKVLESTGNTIGVVTAIAAPTRLRVDITGQADHSGATPMNMRQDALTAAAEIILTVEELGQREAVYGSVGTTGIIKAEPGVMNVIPGKVELGIDIRGISMESKQRIVGGIARAITGIEKKRRITCKIVTLTHEKPVALSGNMITLLSEVCLEQRCAYREMPSGAGHDAMHLAEITETGMIFIPCRGGISHNPSEWASLHDIEIGVNVLFAAVDKLAAKEQVLLV